jgi:hypothetical protein
VFVVDEQQLIAWLGVGETYPAGLSRLAVVGYAAHHMMFREFLVRHREQVVEVFRWQSLDAKAHDHLLVLTAVNIGVLAARYDPFPDNGLHQGVAAVYRRPEIAGTRMASGRATLSRSCFAVQAGTREKGCETDRSDELARTGKIIPLQIGPGRHHRAHVIVANRRLG